MKTIYEVSQEDGGIAVRTFSLLARDYPGASCERDEEGNIVGYKAWSRTQYVGSYDDWQIRQIVEAWCNERGIDPDALPWYEGPAAV